MSEAARAAFPPPDILVNNAGINVFTDPLKTTDQDWRRCMSVDLEGVWRCSRAFLPGMIESGRGSIVNIASTHAFEIIPGCFPYPVAKHAVVGLTRALAIEYAARGVRVNAIAPGYIETPIATEYWNTFPDPEAERQRAYALHPKGNIVRIPYDNHMESAVTAVTTTLTAHPEAKRWIFYSCNDDGVLGGVRATENQGLAPSDIIGIGIDGSRACDAFGSGKPTGFRGTMYIDSGKEGAQAIQLLAASVKNNTPLPETTYVTADLISADNFGSYKDKLCHK